MKFAPALMMIFFNIFLPSLDACQAKLYVAQDAITLENNTIALKLEQGNLLVSALHVDADGYYIDHEDVLEATEAPTEIELENTDSN